MIREDISADTKIIGTYWRRCEGKREKKPSRKRKIMNMESFLFNSLPVGKTNHRKRRTNKHSFIEGRRISKGVSANEWGLTKYYMMPWSTIVGRFGSNGKSEEEEERNNTEKIYFIISARFHIFHSLYHTSGCRKKSELKFKKGKNVCLLFNFPLAVFIPADILHRKS